MEMAKGRSRMDKGEWVKGNGVRPVDPAWEAGTRRPAGRRVPALMALVFVGAVSFVCYGNSREERVSSERSPA
jgi:hypothetical protein